MGRTATLEAKHDQAKGLWYVSLPPKLSPTGKRRREYFPFRREAEERAKRLRKLEQQSVSLARKAGPSLIETAVIYDELFQIYGLSGLKEACEKLAATLEAEHKAVRFDELLDAFEQDHWEDWSKSSRTTWNWLKKHLDDFKEHPLTTLNTPLWTKWMRKMAKQEAWAPRSFNDVVQKISSIWRYAVKQGLAKGNPIDGVKRRKLRKKPVAILEAEQARTIMQTAWEHDRDMVPYFAVAMFAGLRPESELATLRWEDVNFEERWIRVHFGNKTDTKRFVPMEDNLMAWLEPWKEATGSIIPKNLTKRRRYVVRGKYQSPPRTKAANWTPIADWSLRDLARHSYGSYLDGKYRDRNMVKENMGHTDFDTYEQHYRNARTPKQAAAYWSIMPSSVGKAETGSTPVPVSPERQAA